MKFIQNRKIKKMLKLRFYQRNQNRNVSHTTDEDGKRRRERTHTIGHLHLN